MFARRLVFDRSVAYLRWSYALRKSSQHVVYNQEISNLEIRFSDHRKKKETRNPFVKELFCGSFDTEFLVFPEPQPNDRHIDFMSWLKPVEEYVTQCANSTEKLNSDDVVSHIKQLGVFRTTIDLPYGGLNCSESEVAKITETLSILPWLGTYFIKNNILPVRILEKYGSTDQKERFLPGIACGEIIPTICITEKHSKSSINSIETSVIQRTTSSSWKLNGEKNFVYNATKANLFLVLANNVTNNVSHMGDMSICIVEESQPGISCNAIEDTVGLKEVPLCTVEFKNVEVPDKNVIKPTDEVDFNPLVDILCPGRQSTAPQAISILRSFLNLLVKHMLDRKHFDQNMWELDAVKMALSKMATSLYTMESLVYYTAALADEYEDQDLMVERCITETYCANECVDNILRGLKLVGTRSYLRTQPFIKIFEDALSLATFDINDTDSNIYVALLGLQHSGKALQGEVKRARNPNSYPSTFFSSLFSKDPLKGLDIKGHIHPSMQFGALAIEAGITSLNESVRMLFERHGITLIDKHEDMFRLSKTASSMYITVATIARASRAYCIGLKNSTDERNLAVQLACLTHEEITKMTEEIQYKRMVNPDNTFREISKQLYNDKGYFISHVLERIK